MIRSCIFAAIFSSTSYAQVELSFFAQKSIYGAGDIALACEINGVALSKCKLDTGMPFSSIKAGDKIPLGEVFNQVEAKSFTGEMVLCKATAQNSLRLGHQNFEDSLLLSCPKLKSNNVDAILGLDIIGFQPFLLDYGRSLLVLNPETPKDLQSFDQDSAGHILLPIGIGKDSMLSSKAMFDTGAGLSFVDIEYVKNHPDQFTVLNESRAKDTHGNDVFTKVVLIKELSVGSKRLTVEYMMAVDLSEAKKMMGEEVDFILGHNILARANWYFSLERKAWQNW